MRRLLGSSIAVLLALGVGVALQGPRPRERVVVREPQGRRPAPTSTTVGVPRPPAGQFEVEGQAATLTVRPQASPPLGMPATIAVPEVGKGGATIRDALVDGRRVTIVWGGGRPLALSGAGGAIVLGRVTVDLAAGRAVWHLDGAVHGLLAATYRIDSPVAVGDRGLAVPRDQVTFVADARTTIRTYGGATSARSPRAMRLTGPGALDASGRFTVLTHGGRRAARHLSLAAGRFTLEVRPGRRGFLVDAVVNGPLRLSP